jgi:hypothetical protein
VLRLGGELFCCREVLQGRSRNEGGEEEGRALGYILNIINGFTNEIILMVTIQFTILSQPFYRY